MRDIKGIIFDLDGTMVDNMLIHHQAWQRLLSHLGLELTLEEVRQQIHGVNEEILLRLFRNKLTKKERSHYASRKEEEYREIIRPTLELIKGLPEYLRLLQQMKIPLGIGSAAPKENVDLVLDQLELRNLFKATMHAGDVSRGKPDPEVYQKVAYAMGVPVKSCLIFEDSPTGVEAAFRAACSCVVVTSSHRESEFQKFDNIIKFIPDYTGIELIESTRSWLNVTESFE